MIVLRLVDDNGEGIYQILANEICDEIGDTDVAFDGMRHPMPCHDAKLIASGFSPSRMDEYLYGFESYRQYRNWFFSDNFLQLAEEYGAMLYLYDAPPADVYVGHTQVTFLPDNVHFIGSFSPMVSECAILEAIETYRKDNETEGSN